MSRTLANRYELLRELGRGGMGTVHLAKDPLLDREVAVKTIHSGALSTEQRQRFLREARVIAKMDHPGIVGVFDLGEEGDNLFFVMPFVPGKNLREALREGPLSLGQVLDVGIQAAEALDYSHALGIVHRDIKPENIMIAPEGSNLRVRVTDFGVAVAAHEQRLTRTGALVGTALYLSPEQVAGKPIDGRVDIFALGTVLYECLANRTPYDGEFQTVLYRIMHENPTPLRTLAPTIDEELDRLILSCLEKDPAKRPQRGLDVAGLLRRYKERFSTDSRGRMMAMMPTMHADSAQVRVGSAPPPAASPLVGREKEFAELQRRLNMAVAGESQLVLVSGEAGIGKSRLLEEVERLALARQFRVMHGTFAEMTDAFPYQGFCEIIESYCRRGRTPSLAEFADIEQDLVALFPVLGELVSAREPSGRFRVRPEAQGDQDRTHVFELLSRALTRIAGGAPLVLLLEDLHAANVSVEALQYIARRLASTPVLLVGAFTSTEVDKAHPVSKLVEGFKGSKRFALLPLERLTAAEHGTFVTSLVGGSPDEELLKKLYDAAEGNPYFTTELVRSLTDSGSIVKTDRGAFTLSADHAASFDAIPETIQQTVARRLERLSEELRRVLSLASVLGKSFEEHDLEVLVEEDDVDLDAALEKLIKLGFLEEQRKGRGDRLAFTSGATRDVLYAELPRRKRRTLHKKVAEDLETKNAGRLERVHAQLVHHYSQADVAEKVFEYGIRLAKSALAAFSPDDAVRAAKAVLAFAEDEDGEAKLEAETRALLAAGYRMGGNLEGALKETELALKLFEEARDTAHALEAIVTAADTAWEARRVGEAKRWVDRGLPLARAEGGDVVLSRLLSLGITLANLRGDPATAGEFLAEIDRLKPPATVASPAAPEGGTARVAIASAIAASEPAEIEVNEETEVLATVFEPLLGTDAHGNLVPRLCDRWEVAEGGGKVTVRLRPNVEFHDQTPLDAETVKASFERSTKKSRELPQACALIRGAGDYREGRAPRLAGIEVTGPLDLVIHLTEPLPFYPALLAHTRTGIVRALDGDGVVGTGPFKLGPNRAGVLKVERHERYWRDKHAALDAVEFHHSLATDEIAAGLRAGKFELVRDVAPLAMEEMLRDRRLGARTIETPKKNVYFAAFNRSSALARHPGLRRALFGSVRTQDIVWKNLGRLARPAEGLVPPGVPGHDAGRRRALLDAEAAQALLREVPRPLELRVVAHPIFLDRYKAVTEALVKGSTELGVEIAIVAHDFQGFRKFVDGGEGADVLLARWFGEYDDPDAFTHALFHSAHGYFRAPCSSPELDRLLAEARLEAQPAQRAARYRAIETQLLEEHWVLPLFHDIDCRLHLPTLENVSLGPTPPFVGYASLRKIETNGAAHAQPARRGTIHVSTVNKVNDFDPRSLLLAEHADVAGAVFESLTFEGRGALVVPWLAEHFESEDGGRRYRFRLRDNVRFHDGRRLTSRDVRYTLESFFSFERSTGRAAFAAIRGAKDVIAGKTRELAGFHIASPLEFTIELEEPLGILPALLTTPQVSIVPEGSSGGAGSWRTGLVGTGPFRIERLDPGRRLELEANPHYWRPGLPRAEGLVVHLGVSFSDAISRFRAGQLSMVSQLPPADFDALLRDPAGAAGFHEIPELSTAALFFNTHNGVFRDVEVRRRVAQAIDVTSLARHLGRRAARARSFLPPGLVNEGVVAAPAAGRPDTEFTSPLEVSCLISPNFDGKHPAVTRELVAQLARARVKVKPESGVLEPGRADPDLYLGWWVADFPDADTFMSLLHSTGEYGHFSSSPALDPLVERTRMESDPRVRRALCHDFEEFLAREAVLVPLCHENRYSFARPEVRGVGDDFLKMTIGRDYASLWIAE